MYMEYLLTRKIGHLDGTPFLKIRKYLKAGYTYRVDDGNSLF